MLPLFLLPAILSAPLGPSACTGGPCTVPDTIAVLLSPVGDGIAVHTNFGLVTSADGATDWRLVCEESYGSTLANRDRVAPDGALFVASYDGLFSTTSGGCCWTKGGGALGDNPTWDVAFDATKPGRVFTTMSDEAADTESLAQSDDGGKTFTIKKTFLPATRLGGLATAPSDPRFIYLSGYLPAPTRFLIAVSEDGGGSFAEVKPFGDGYADARLLGIDAGDPRVVLLARRGLTGKPDEIYRSIDEGRAPTLTLALQGTEDARGFTFGADGASVFVGGKEAGAVGGDNPRGTLYASHDGGKSWDAPIKGGPGYRCLGFRKGVLYACAGDELGEDPFALGASDDGGKSWRAVMRFADMAGAPGCIRDVCKLTTEGLCTLFGYTCGMGAGGAGGSPDCSGSGGAGGGGGGGAGGDGAVDAPADAATDQAKQDLAGDGGSGGGTGCSCELGPLTRSRALPWIHPALAALAAALAALGARRRTR